MKRTWMAIVPLVGLTACTTYVEHRSPAPPPPQPAYVEPTPVEIVIHDERDFYEPLSPYGHWEYIGSYGRCWVPARVESDWRPYSNGHWERTDAGWYWVSDEPWGWATYHYGRWDFDARFGWYWIPQTMWAPAWVSWRESNGYIGWSPLPPSARIAPSGVIEVNARAIPQRGCVVVEQRRFLEPIRPAMVVNNTTIINNTVNITNVKIVNNTVINEGPRTQVIEQASGHKLRTVPARDLRRKMEAPVAASRPAQGNDRDREPNAKQVPAVTGATAPAPARTPTEPDRKADERARQDKIDADRQTQEQQRKAQAEAERVRAESDRQAKIEADRKAQAERARVEAEQRKADTERKAQLEAEKRANAPAQKAQAEAARKKQEADLHAREQADREARQKQAQMDEARRKQGLDRKAQADAQDAAARRAQEPSKKNEVVKESQAQSQQTQPVNAKSPGVQSKGSEKKNQTEAERRAREQQKAKGKAKKTPETQPAPPATNAPPTTPL